MMKVYNFTSFYIWKQVYSLSHVLYELNSFSFVCKYWRQFCNCFINIEQFYIRNKFYILAQVFYLIDYILCNTFCTYWPTSLYCTRIFLFSHTFDIISELRLPVTPQVLYYERHPTDRFGEYLFGRPLIAYNFWFKVWWKTGVFFISNFR